MNACQVEERQGRGYASNLLSLLRSTAEGMCANLYVLALEESCVFFMNKGFVLEEDGPINDRLNVFPDTHLLKHTSNRAEDPSSFTAAAPGESQ